MIYFNKLHKIVIPTFRHASEGWHPACPYERGLRACAGDTVVRICGDLKQKSSETPLPRLGDEEVAEDGDALGVFQFFRVDKIRVEFRCLHGNIDLYQA